MIIEAANNMALKLRTQGIRVTEVTVTLDPRDWTLAIVEMAELSRCATIRNVREAFSVYAYEMTFTFRPGVSSIVSPHRIETEK